MKNKTTPVLRVRLLAKDFQRLRLDERLTVLAVALIPFQSAFTVDVGVPLKISEVLIGCALVMRLVVIKRAPLRTAWHPDLTFIAVFAACLVASTALALIFADLSEPIRGTARPAAFDLLFYFTYGTFVVMAWLLFRGIDPKWTFRAMITSVWLCLAAIILQVIFRLAGIGPALSAVGFDMTPRGLTFLGATFSRSGPFVEGQHLGFYAGAMLVIALYNGRYITSLAAVVCIAFSESTTGIAGAAIALLASALLKPRRTTFIILGALTAAGSLLVMTSSAARDFVFLQLAKLGLAQSQGGNPLKSLDVRSAKSDVGWRMMWDNLPFGVGPGRYAAHFATYENDYPSLVGLHRPSSRPIVENGYFQIGAELGLIALAAFLAYMIWLGWRAWRHPLSPGPLALFVFFTVGLATQSSWTFLPIWLILAFLSSVAIRTTNEDPRRPDYASTASKVVDTNSPSRTTRREWRASQPSARRRGLH